MPIMASKQSLLANLSDPQGPIFIVIGSPKASVIAVYASTQSDGLLLPIKTESAYIPCSERAAAQLPKSMATAE
jgi:hypothetical protein